MRQQTKYFVWNKVSDYVRGSGVNIRLLSPGISVASEQQGSGVYFSRLMDSREKQMEYHRLLTEGEDISEATVRFWIYASESRTLYWEGEQLDIQELLQDPELTSEQKTEMTAACCQKITENPRDILLHEVKGRYLWLRIRLTAQGGLQPRIRKMKIIFPKNTCLEYLPDVYQEDRASASFVERYLGMFQSLYQDMTKQIWDFPAYLDPETASGPFLKWLASWLSIEDSYLWNEIQLRWLICHGMELYRKRGTVDCMQQMVKLYTGKTPYIVEYFQLEPYLNRPGYAERLMELYGKNRYMFTVIVDMNGQITNHEYHVLTRIVEQAKPAHMDCSIIVLEPYIFLDKHSYMGINSVLGHYGAAVLDGQASIPFAALTASDEGKGEIS